MHEYIGTCKNCGVNIYCENGFFNGVLLPGHEYLCFECEDKLSGEHKQENNNN